MAVWKHWVGLVALLTAVTAIVTYPQILHLTGSVRDFGDPLLNAWALAWTPHALITPADGTVRRQHLPPRARHPGTVRDA